MGHPGCTIRRFDMRERAKAHLSFSACGVGRADRGMTTAAFEGEATFVVIRIDYGEAFAFCGAYCHDGSDVHSVVLLAERTHSYGAGIEDYRSAA